jgi:hypothetical protein
MTRESETRTTIEEPEAKYAEGSLTEFWKKQGVVPVPVTPCKEGEQGFSWSEFINGLGRRTPGTDGNGPE